MEILKNEERGWVQKGDTTVDGRVWPGRRDIKPRAPEEKTHSCGLCIVYKGERSCTTFCGEYVCRACAKVIANNEEVLDDLGEEEVKRILMQVNGMGTLEGAMAQGFHYGQHSSEYGKERPSFKYDDYGSSTALPPSIIATLQSKIPETTVVFATIARTSCLDSTAHKKYGFNAAPIEENASLLWEVTCKRKSFAKNEHPMLWLMSAHQAKSLQVELLKGERVGERAMKKPPRLGW
jgi:hypothetical protein